MTPFFKADGIAVYNEPPRDYLDWLAASNAFFDGPDWGAILRAGFGVRRLYLWDRRHLLGHALSIFRKGPFTMGYLGFPVCAGVDSSTGAPYKLDRMVAAICGMPRTSHLLRIPVSAFGQRILSASFETVAKTVETCITNLPKWSKNATSKRRRDARYADRHCGHLEPCHMAEGREILDLYKTAMRRNHGQLRYTPKYFNALAHALESNSVQLAGLASRSALASMALTASHGNTTYYLHGGSLPDALKQGASDLVMQCAIERAQASGSQQFNFLSSPTEQRGLIRFKEKWGGTSQLTDTVTTATSSAGRILVMLKT